MKRLIFLLQILLTCQLGLAQTVVSLVEPSSSVSGNEITIYGAGFVTTPANNTVTFDGTNAVVNSATTTVLTVAVPSLTVGPTQVVVSNVNGTSQAVYNFTTIEADEGGTFVDATFHDAGNPFRDIITADFDNDDIVDVAGTNLNGITYISLGDGDGTFTNSASVSKGTNLAVGDFDNDGNTDLVVANAIDGDVSIITGDGDGTFGTPNDYAVGSFPIGIMAADFDRDGDLDVAVSNFSDDDVSVLLGDGSGGLGTATDLPVGDQPLELVAADFTNDGILDLVVTNSNDDNVSVLVGNGSGGFGTATDFNVGNRPEGIAAADFNDDGDLDIAVANSFDHNVSILLGDGTGSFGSADNFATSNGPNGIVSSDFNGDGIIDLATSNNGSTDNISLLIGNGDGTFKTAKNFDAGPDPTGLAFGDVDSDGIIDILVGGNDNTDNVTILIGESPVKNNVTTVNNSFPSFSIAGEEIILLGAAFDLTPGNNTVTVDGVDAVVSNVVSEREMQVTMPSLAAGPAAIVVDNANGTSSNVVNHTLLRANAGGVFGNVITISAGGSATGIVQGDFNGDGVVDLVTANKNDDNISILIGNDDGTFQTANNFAAGIESQQIISGDFDVNGTLDVAMANGFSSNITILDGNGDGTFGSPENYSASTPLDLAAGDFNNNGFLDFAVANIGDNVGILLNNGDGTFATQVIYSAGDQPEGITVGDFDGDGNLDIATANSLGDNCSILIGNGDGTFEAFVNYNTNNASTDVTSGDFNNDGDLDLAVGGANLSILLGVGDGTFNAAVNYAATFSNHVNVGDFNGDGIQDILAGGIDLFVGIGDGTFEDAVNYSVGSVVDCVIGDFDSNGLLDIASVSSNDIRTLINQFGPTIFKIENNGAIAGDMVEITGHGFSTVIGNNTVTFDGTSASINSATEETLSVTVPVVATGPVEVVVSTQFGESNSHIFYVIEAGSGGGLRDEDNSTLESIPAGEVIIPGGVTLADFNNDGIEDAATVNDFIGNGSVIVLIADGSGQFTQTDYYTTSDDPRDILAADFNSDGNIDIATSNFDDGEVGISLGNGDGTFGIPTAYVLEEGLFPSGASHFTSGDFNGDGIVDIVASRSDDNLAILFGFGDGTFSLPTEIFVGDSGDILTGEFTSDGITDILICLFSTDKVVVLPGNGDGTFDPAVNTNSGDMPLEGATGDFDDDSITDLLVTHSIDQRIGIFIGAGNGSFSTPDYYNITGFGQPIDLVIGDMNGNGIDDIVLAATSGVSLIPGNGDGTFQTEEEFGFGSEDVQLADVDGDGILDVIKINSSSSSNFTVFIGANTGTDITGFSLAEEVATAIIDANNHTVTAEVAAGTDVSALSPTISLSQDATVFPLSGSQRDFSSTVNYTVTADDQNTMQQWSADVIAVPETTVLTLNTIDQTTANLSWGVPAFTDSFELEISTSSDFSSFITGYDPMVLDNATVTESVSSLNAGTRYYARIRALNSLGSASTNSITAEILTLPETPVLNMVANGDLEQTSASISWTAVSGIVNDYQVEVSSTDFDITTTLLPDYPLTVAGSAVVIGEDLGTNGLTPGTNYWCRVSARNDSGESPNSNVEAILTKPVTPTLNVPLLSEIEQTSATVSWDAVSGIVDNYRMDVSDDNFTTYVDGFEDVLIADESIEITGLSPGTVYEVRLRSENSSGQSENSMVISVLTKPATPDLNNIAISDIQQASAEVSWPTVSGVVDNYIIEVSSTDFSSPQLLDGYPATVSGTTFNIGIDNDTEPLSGGSTYWVRIRSVNASGESPNSAVEMFLTKPATPTLNNASDITQTSATISWDAVSGAVDDYRLDVSQDDFQTFISGFNGAVIGTTTTDLTELSPGLTYEARVRANNASGQSTNSNVIEFLTIPANPTATAAAAITSGSFQATWNAVAGAAYYQLEVSDDDFSSLIVDETVTGQLFQDVTGLSTNNEYKYRLSAGNATGASGYSNEVTVTTSSNTSPLGLDISFTELFNVEQASTDVEISVNGGEGPITVVARYKGLVGNDFSTDEVLTGSNGEYTFTINAEMLDEMGIAFEIEASDINNSLIEEGKLYLAFNDSQSPAVAFERFGGTASTWNIFSIPYELDNTSIQNVFENYNPSEHRKSWRVMRYRNNSNDYVDFNNGQNTLGEAYWFNAKDDLPINIGAGQVNTTIPFPLALLQGWNMIGNPYNVPISWDQVLIDNGNPPGVEGLFVFNGTEQSSINMMAPFSGGFVWTDEQVTFNISPISAASGGRIGESEETKHTSKFNSDQDWQLMFSYNGQSLGGFGMHPNAVELKDEYDAMTLPRFVAYTELYTVREAYFYPWFSTDVVPSYTDYVWDFTLASNISKDKSYLQWDNSLLAQSESQWYLLDKINGRLVDMKVENLIQIDLSQHDFEFEVHFNSDGGPILPGQIILGRAFPNPATHKVIIPLAIPEELDAGTIDLSIYDIDGKKVKTLISDEVNAGYHEYEWVLDGDTSPGLYIYQVVFQKNQEPVQRKLIIR